jgi:hypothetical protein
VFCVELVALRLGVAGTNDAVLIDGDVLTLVDTGIGDAGSNRSMEAAFGARGPRVEEIEQITLPSRGCRIYAPVDGTLPHRLRGCS